MPGADRDADRIGVRVAVHPQHVGDGAGAAIDRAIAEDVGDMHRVLAVLRDHSEVAGNRQLSFDDGLVSAGHLVGQVDAVVGHRAHEQPAARIEGEVVEAGLEAGDQALGLAAEAHLPDRAVGGVDDEEIVAALRIDVDRRGNFEAVGDHLDRAAVDIDLDRLALEPQRAVELAVVLVDLEAVQAAQLLGDAAQLGARDRLELGLVDILDIDLVERVTQEHLRHEQPQAGGSPGGEGSVA